MVTLRPVALEFSRAAGLRAALSRVHRGARRIHSFLLQHRSGSFRPGLRLTGKLLEQSAWFFHQTVPAILASGELHVPFPVVLQIRTCRSFVQAGELREIGRATSE